MSSKVIDHSRAGDTVLVVVEHLDSDSFSRSVDRAAMRWARRAPVFRGKVAALVDGEYAHTTQGRTCLSTLRFEVRS